jgi:flagellar FliL protein
MKKLLPWLISLLVAITLIAGVCIYVWAQFFSGLNETDPQAKAAQAAQNVEVKPMSADELLKVTSELTNIKTNIADTSYVVVMSLIFQLDSEKSKTEFDKIKEIAVRPIVNRALWLMQPGDLQGTEGKDRLYAELINSVNAILTVGKVTKIEIKEFIMQQI